MVTDSFLLVSSSINRNAIIRHRHGIINLDIKPNFEDEKTV